MGKLSIIGIANGKKENLTIKAYEKIESAEKLFLQTGEIPFGNELKKDYKTFDRFFEESEDFDILKKSIAKELVHNSKQSNIVFCALGDIAQNEVVSEIIEEANKGKIELEIIYGLPCDCENIGMAMVNKEIKPYGIKTISGYSFEMPDNSNEGMHIYEIDSLYLASEIKIELLKIFGGDKTVYISNEQTKSKKILLEELDRQQGYGYSFCAYIPPSQFNDKTGYTFSDLLKIMSVLRSVDGCPWDKEQTHKTLRKFLLEESYEVLDAIENDSMDMLYDELGDVLLQVVFHGQIGKEHREFDSLDITTAICKKMISRHPHVFGQTIANTSKKVLDNWEKLKEEEKGIDSFTHNLKDVPKAMPSLMRSQKVQKRAAACGFDWDDYRLPLKKVYEELGELEEDIKQEKNPEEEMGDLLFAITNLARHLKINAEMTLYKGVEKFIMRFEDMEKQAEESNISLDKMTLDEMDLLWEKSKKRMSLKKR
jgi:tetrapyrrole methylase family protein / MazG family protein